MGRTWPRHFDFKLSALAFGAALLVLISRRPDVITHAQFWAEDGRVSFSDVYNRGFLATLVVPQSGYYQTLTVVSAGMARMLPLAWAPLAMNLVAIAIRALPVALLMSDRARTISPDRRVRGLLAALYIALPGLPPEANGNVDNALWYLAVSAVIVVMLAAPVRRRERLGDALILLGCATTGVFAIALAPLAFIYRHRYPTRVPRTTVGILGAGAVLQLTSLLVIQHHVPSGFGLGPRISAPLFASPDLGLQILGARVLLPAVLGNGLPIGANVSILAGACTVVLGLLAFRRAPDTLRLFLAFAGLLFVMALAHPQVSWPYLALASSSGRYFIIPDLAVMATLVWAAKMLRRHVIGRVALGALLLIVVMTVSTGWSYRPYRNTNFTAKATAFEHSPPGTHVTFALNPRPWSMTLIKR